MAERLPLSSLTGEGIDTVLTRPTLPQNGEIAKLVATTVSTLSGLDADIALRTADTAVRYNLLNHIPDQEGVDTATEIFEEGLKYVNDTAHEGIEYAQEIIGQNPLIQNDPLTRLQHEARTFVAHELADAALPTTVIGVAMTVAPIGKAKDALKTGKAVGQKIASSLAKTETQLGKSVAEGVIVKASKDVGHKSVPNKLVSQPSLLPAPKMVKHHIFNKFRGQSIVSEKYREFFKNHKINVDDFSISIPETMHRSKIHAAKNNWTTEWKVWIDRNPNATTKEVYQKAGEMMDRYGVNHVPIIKY